MHTFTITANDAGQRLDKFISKRMPSMPKGMLYKLIRKKDIRLNGARCKGAEQLREGDTVIVESISRFASADRHLRWSLKTQFPVRVRHNSRSSSAT